MLISDAPWMGTGFAEELKNIAFRLAQSGRYAVYYLALQYFGHPLKFFDYQFPELPQKGASITVLGNTAPVDLFGAPAFKDHYKEVVPELVFFMGDPRNIRPYVEPPFNHKQTLKFPMVMYLTLDGVPINPGWFTTLRQIDVLFCMTDWALNEYNKIGLNNLGGYVHHGENVAFWTNNPTRKKLLRQQYGIPEDYVLFYNSDVNQHRKRKDALLRCWRDAHPENKKMLLFLNTDLDCELGQRIGGYPDRNPPFVGLIEQYDVPRKTIITPFDIYGKHKNWTLGEPIEHMRDAMAMADVYLSCTSGEGFGKNLLQSICMNVPVITGNYSSMPEVLKEGSILIDPYEGRMGKFRWNDASRSVEGWLINEEKFTDAILRLYDNKNEREELGLRGREWALNFDYDTKIMPAWLSILNRLNPDEMFLNLVLNT
jgi:glycosyltransferase involved in cell wall biosynthesis